MISFLNKNKGDIAYLICNKDRYIKSYYLNKITGEKEFNELNIDIKSDEYRKITYTRYPYKNMLLKINDHLSKHFVFQPCAHGSIKGRHVVSNSAPHRSNKYFFRTDISKFFPSVSAKRIRETLMEELHLNSKWAKMLSQLLTYEDRLPQGFCTSPFVANLVACKLDRRLSRLSILHGLSYTRYVDDISISSAREIPQNIIKTIIGIIKDQGFKINESKTHLREGNTELPGVFIHNGKIYPKQKLIESINDNLSKEQFQGKQAYVNYILRSNRQSV